MFFDTNGQKLFTVKTPYLTVRPLLTWDIGLRRRVRLHRKYAGCKEQGCITVTVSTQSMGANVRQSRQVSNSEMRLSHEFVIRKSETFEDHLASNIVFLLKKYFCGRPSELFFRHPVLRKQFFWPYDQISPFKNRSV